MHASAVTDIMDFGPTSFLTMSGESIFLWSMPQPTTFTSEDISPSHIARQRIARSNIFAQHHQPLIPADETSFQLGSPNASSVAAVDTSGLLGPGAGQQDDGRAAFEEQVMGSIPGNPVENVREPRCDNNQSALQNQLADLHDHISNMELSMSHGGHSPLGSPVSAIADKENMNNNMNQSGAFGGSMSCSEKDTFILACCFGFLC